LRNKLAHHRQLKNSLTQLGDVFLYDIELAEVFGEEGLSTLVLIRLSDVQ